MKKLLLILVVLSISQFVTAQSISNARHTNNVSPNYFSGDTLKTHFVTLGLSEVSSVELIKIVLVDQMVELNNIEILVGKDNLGQLRTASGEYEFILGDYINLLFDRIEIHVNNSTGEVANQTITIQ